MTEVASVKA